MQFRREASGMVLRVQIDRPGPAATEEESVSVADCSKVSRDLSALLDVEDLIPGAYPGFHPGVGSAAAGSGDYERFVGRCAKLVLREAVDGFETFFRGRLAGVEDDVVMLDGEGDRRHIVTCRSHS